VRNPEVSAFLVRERRLSGNGFVRRLYEFSVCPVRARVPAPRRLAHAAVERRSLGCSAIAAFALHSPRLAALENWEPCLTNGAPSRCGRDAMNHANYSFRGATASLRLTDYRNGFAVGL
jgi:hypothetical protein